MKIKISAKLVLPFLLLSGIYFQGKAQNRSVSFEARDTSGNASTLVNALRLTIRNKEKTAYAFDTSSVKEVIPAAIQKAYVWSYKGKNTQRASPVNQIDNSRLIPLLVAAIKEQSQEIIILKRQIDALEEKSSKPSFSGK